MPQGMQQFMCCNSRYEIKNTEKYRICGGKFGIFLLDYGGKTTKNVEKLLSILSKTYTLD